MIHYEKPIVSIDTGMAEGIYAASGATESAVSLSGLTVSSNWGSSGHLTFTADFSKLSSLSQLTLNITFNTTVNIWGGGSTVNSNNSQTVSLYWYSAPTTADFTVAVNTDPTTVKITGYTYSTQA